MEVNIATGMIAQKGSRAGKEKGERGIGCPRSQGGISSQQRRLNEWHQVGSGGREEGPREGRVRPVLMQPSDSSVHVAGRRSNEMKCRGPPVSYLAPTAQVSRLFSLLYLALQPKCNLSVVFCADMLHLFSQLYLAL